MKIIGLILTWNNVEFLRCAFKQAWSFCDELILVEGCQSRFRLKTSTDGTVAFVNSVGTHPRLRIIDFDQKMDRYDNTQRNIRRLYPMESRYYEPGNWVFHWDDDLLFFDKDLPKVRRAMKSSKEDSLDFGARHFIYNFRFNCVRNSGIYCYRITDGLRLKGISTAYYADGQRYSIKKINDITAFHYGQVKRPERMKARWEMSMEKGTESSIGLYEKWMGVCWEKEEDILKQEQLIRQFTGGGELNIYDGPHPETAADHPWRHIDDVRAIG